jgi:predicted ATPase
MRVPRIVVTGGPGGGKTTLWNALSQAHAAQLVAVPEVATLMFRHVFPQVRSEPERQAVQRAIFQVQCSIEEFHAGRLTSGQILLCDRGTPDGGGYWPAGHQAFFSAMNTDWQAELARYDAVIFLETAAARGLSIADGNAVRTEDHETAVAIDRRLFDVWSTHPHFVHVPCDPDFTRKIARAQQAVVPYLGSEPTFP